MSFPQHKENNIFLSQCGLEKYKSKELFKKDISKLAHFEDERFTYKNIQETSLEDFLKVFDIVAEDDKERTGSTLEYFQEMKEMAEDKFNEDWWKTIFYQDKAIGIILPQIYPDTEDEGSIFYIGLIPEYRNQGLGKIIHKSALVLLKEIGATMYYGSTLTTNKGMMKLFEFNDCKFVCTQQYYKLK